MRRFVLPTLLLFWLLGILFPMAFLANHWPAFGRVFHAVFAPNWRHILMHLLLYAVLAFLLSVWLRPRTIRSCLLLAFLVLVVGLLHETFQLLAQQKWPGWQAEAFDLTIDLAGAILGWLTWKVGRPNKTG
ncbi:MAG: VanZ family protein [Anaerolineales bacterium]|nr:VanZ family protein [Anaerolineales bacterium]MCX7608902.1 VanZ family protein [Anaerolineales bacterium]